MSWPYLRAAAALRRMPLIQKGIALALGDAADVNGIVSMSNRALREWTNSSEQSVRRGVRGLAKRALLALTVPGDAKTQTPAVYALHYPGASVAGGSYHDGRRSPATEADQLLPPGHLNDRSLIRKAGKAGEAGASRPVRPVENRNDAPTDAQLRKLVHAVLDEEGFTSDSDLAESVKVHGAQLAGFDYAADIERLHRAIAAVVGQRITGRREARR